MPLSPEPAPALAANPMARGGRPRQPLFEAALCLAAGIALADWAVRTQRAQGAFWLPVGGLLAVAAALACLGHGGVRRWALRMALGLLAACAFMTHETRDPGRLLAERIAPAGSVLRGSGWVDQEPVPGAARFYVGLESVALDGGPAAETRARVAVRWPEGLPTPEYGDRLAFAGSAHRLARPRNPGEFDAPAVRARQGVFTEVEVRYPADAKVLAHGAGHSAIALSLRLRRSMAATMARGLEDSPEVVSVIQSMTLGTQADIDRSILDLFRYTGTIHLFSVSGIHTAMLAAMAFMAFQMACLSRRWAALAVIPVLWGYCFVTGLTPSSLRATIMASIALGGIVLERPALSWNTLGASALVILVADPAQLFRPGFQLSFLMVAVLLAGATPLQKFFLRWVRPDPFLPCALWSRPFAARAWALHQGAAALGVSVAAWLGSMPLTVGYFNLWSPASVPANLVAVAFSWFILALGLASAAAGAVSTWLCVVLNNANWLCARALMGVLSLLAAAPGSHFYVEKPSWRAAPVCEIEVLDLADGGAIHLRTRAGDGRRRDWMLDCGGAGALRWSVLPYLRSRGVNALDGLVLTHGDSRHLGGAGTLLDAMPVGEVYDSAYRDRSSLRRAIHTVLAHRASGKAILVRGDTVTLARGNAGIALHVLYPPAGLRLRTADDKALVLRLDVATAAGRTVRVLFTSDAGFPTEEWLLDHVPAAELRSDLLVKGRHAADLSGTPAFLAAVEPRAVVTSGAPFPTAQRVPRLWAAQVRAAGIALFRQDKTGAVRIAIGRDGQWNLQAFLEGAATPAPLRSSSR